MSSSISSVYHPPIQKYEIEKTDSLYDLSLVYSKYLGLFRIQFRIVSTTFDWVKLLPISDNAKALIGSQDAFIRLFNSTLNLPMFVISQIGFYSSFNKLKKELYQNNSCKISQVAINFFFNSVSLSLSTVKLVQVAEKFNWARLAKISPRLPLFLSKSSNLFTVLLVGRGLANSIVLLNSQANADYASPTWSRDGFSPKTRRTITSVAVKSLNFFYLLTTAAFLHFGIVTNPILLLGISSTSLILGVSNNIDVYKKMLWEPVPAPIPDKTSYLPA